MILEANRLARPDVAPAAVPPSVLVVDDEPLICDVLQRFLEVHGFRVLVAGSGQEAVELFRNERGTVDLVLLDVRMPGMDGPATLAALRCLDPRVRSCFMSGDLGQYTADELTRLGALALFEKPLSLGELTAALRHLISSPAASA